MHDWRPIEPLSTADALDQGVTPAQLRRPVLPAPFRGVRTPEAPTTHLERIRAYAPLLRAGHAFSHVSAAVLWNLWLPAWCEFATTVDVTSIGAARPARMAGVRGHHADIGTVDITVFEGLRVTSPLDTFRCLAPSLTIDELVAAGDSLVQRCRPLLTLAELDRVIGRHAGNRGNKKLRVAMSFVRVGCDSPRETDLRLVLVRAGLPEPVVNAIVSAPGERLRYGDLVYPEWKVIVEYDGRGHLEPAQVASDILRLEQLTRAGWVVIRVVHEHFADPHSIVRRVRDALLAAGWRP